MFAPLFPFPPPPHLYKACTDALCKWHFGIPCGQRVKSLTPTVTVMLYFSHMHVTQDLCSLTHTPLNCTSGSLYMLLPLYLYTKDTKVNVLNSFSVHIMDGCSQKKGLTVQSGSKKHYGVRDTSKACLCISFSYKIPTMDAFHLKWTKEFHFILYIISVYPNFLFQPTCRDIKESKEMLQVVMGTLFACPDPELKWTAVLRVHTCIYIYTWIHIYT